MKKRRKRKNYKIRLKIKIYLFIFILIFFLAFAIFIRQFEKYVVPSVIAISEKYATNMISLEINRSVEKTVNEMRVVTDDFLNKSFNKGGSNFLDVDTILINNLCNSISVNLSQKLISINDTKMKLPIGIFSGFNAFYGVGPKFSTYVSTTGDAQVDYETKFESVGINQINFQVWLKIDTKVRIINPLCKKDISVSRKLMLVNTVFNGQVPGTYLNMTPSIQ